MPSWDVCRVALHLQSQGQDYFLHLSALEAPNTLRIMPARLQPLSSRSHYSALSVVSVYCVCVCIPERERVKARERAGEGRRKRAGGREAEGCVCAPVCSHRSEEDTGHLTLAHPALLPWDRDSNWNIARMAARKCRFHVSYRQAWTCHIFTRLLGSEFRSSFLYNRCFYPFRHLPSLQLSHDALTSFFSFFVFYKIWLDEITVTQLQLQRPSF